MGVFAAGLPRGRIAGAAMLLYNLLYNFVTIMVFVTSRYLWAWAADRWQAADRARVLGARVFFNLSEAETAYEAT